MPNITYLVIGIVVGYIIARLHSGKGISARRDSTGSPQARADGLIMEQAGEKKRNLEAILGLLETNTPLTNNHIEQMLGIPESTVTRYMDELEKQGKVRQVGDAGRYVAYELVNGSTR